MLTSCATCCGSGPHKARFARVTVLPPGCDKILRYVRDRISVPRDMSLHAARVLRACLETTAAEVQHACGIIGERPFSKDPFAVDFDC